MARLISGSMALAAVLTILLLVPGCSEESPNEVPPNSSAGAPGTDSPGPGAGQGARSNPKLKEIMTKVGKGPQALRGARGDALKQGEPAWDTIQAKTRDYAQLASEMGTFEPVRGTKDSWAKLTQAFAESAAELDHAAQAKEKEKTKSALDSLGSSCMGCHRQHRVMGPGMGPPGGGGMGPPPGIPTAGQWRGRSSW